MKKGFLPALVALIGLALMPAASMAKTYVNGIDANYPPFAYVDKQGKPAGFDVECMDWIAKKMGFAVEHKPMDWDGILMALNAKKIDMVCSGMSITPERQKEVTFSEPYFEMRKVFVVKKDKNATIEEIFTGKKRIGVQRGTNEHEMLEARLEKKEGGSNYTLRFYDSAPLAIEDLLNGRIDAAGMDNAPAADAVEKGKAVKIVGAFTPPEDFGVATRHDDAELRKLINEGYKLIKADPIWKKLLAKHKIY